MTNQQHPITPPPKLFKQWEDDILNERDNVDYVLDCAWKNGFQAGADQELEACCEWMLEMDLAASGDIEQLLSERRPKPPSLKEQALAALGSIERGQDRPEDTDTIRRALEQLND
jgi:hypothetical protein